MTTRLLTKEEISSLISRGCIAVNWEKISVEEGFSTSSVLNTVFNGEVTLGNFASVIKDPDGTEKNCGIFNSSVSNCVISGKSRISDVKNLSNYIIEDNVIIENIGSLVVAGKTSFGNGTVTEVLNEGGGRELPVFDRLSSQLAYLAVLYRHNPEFTEKILGIINNYVKDKEASKGIIGSGAVIRDTLAIKNVMVGNNAVISGAASLEEGTIASCREAPAIVGSGVIARKFIILSGSSVESGAILDKSFVGQGVKMGKQFSAENSLFFANCEAFHGEACSLFAGPYTVTHHKSTLLIASLFSFFNAGSGTNQSNHMYKLGPVHQGILERGSKTGSFAYLLLPAHVGAFTVVMGKHLANFNTEDFPFSYISEEKGKSELTPAMNIFTVGTRRDSEKWPVRDRRKDPEKLDLIHFDLFSPYITGKIVNAINILNDLAEKTDKKLEYVNYKGINIHRLLLKTSRKYYEMGLNVYVGQQVIKRLANAGDDLTIEKIRSLLKPTGKGGQGRWVEICGLFSPADKIEELTEDVASGKISDLAGLENSLKNIFHKYDEYAWNWCADLIGKQTGNDVENLTTEAFIQIITAWKTNAVKLNNMIMKDAEKEFDSSSKTGFGVDGDDNTRDMDFRAVRGDYETNKFVTGLRKESEEIGKKADKLIEMVSAKV